MNHKFLSATVILLVIIVALYSYGRITNTSANPKYILATVKKGAIVLSVNASGQVSAQNQVDVKPKISGDLWWIGVKPGDKVYQGQALMSIDNTDAKKALSDAEQSYQSAELQLQKDQIQAPIDYQNAVDALAKAKNDLVTTYNDAFNTISNTYIDLPTIVTTMKNILFGYDLSPNRSQWNADVLVNMFTDKTDETNYRETLNALVENAKSAYNTALTKYNDSVVAYQEISRYSDNAVFDSILSKTNDTAIAIADTFQRELNLIGKVIDISKEQNQNLSSTVTTMQGNAKNYLSSTNTIINNLLSQKKSIDDAKKTITSAQQNITLLEVGNPKGNNPISLQISTRDLQRQKEDLDQQKADLADYTIVAPFAGTIASVPVKNSDTVGTGTTLTTIISNQKIAALTLNEVDAAKIRVGNKATLTFDAIENLSLTGSVIEIDPLGTVSQGVVSYSLKIAFDTQNDEVKPGMTVNAAIITEVKQDVLTVPSGAIKTSGNTNYILMFNPPIADTDDNQEVTSSADLIEQVVTIGLSDDTNTEIVSGLTEGNQIVSRVVNASNTSSASSQSVPSLLGGGVRTSSNNAVFRATTGGR